MSTYIQLHQSKIVWAEAKLVPMTVANDEHSESQLPPSHSQKSDISTAYSTNHSSVTNSTATPRNNKNESHPNDPLLLPISNCLDILFGIPFTFVGIVVTFLTELASTITYFIAWGCYYLSCGSCVCSETGPIIWILYIALRPVVGVCLLVDALILLTSIFVTEILALTSRLLTCLSGGCSSGKRWHQYIRRICHLFRWAWRQTHSNLEPKRLVPSCCQRKNELAPSKTYSAGSQKAFNEKYDGTIEVE